MPGGLGEYLPIAAGEQDALHEVSLAEKYADTQLVIAGIPGTLSDLIKKCPVDLTNATAEQMNPWVIRGINAAGGEIQSEDQPIFDAYLQQHNIEQKYSVSTDQAVQKSDVGAADTLNKINNQNDTPSVVTPTESRAVSALQKVETLAPKPLEHHPKQPDTHTEIGTDRPVDVPESEPDTFATSNQTVPVVAEKAFDTFTRQQDNKLHEYEGSLDNLLRKDELATQDPGQEILRSIETVRTAAQDPASVELAPPGAVTIHERAYAPVSEVEPLIEITHEIAQTKVEAFVDTLEEVPDTVEELFAEFAALPDENVDIEFGELLLESYALWQANGIETPSTAEVVALAEVLRLEAAIAADERFDELAAAITEQEPLLEPAELHQAVLFAAKTAESQEAAEEIDALYTETVKIIDFLAAGQPGEMQPNDTDLFAQIDAIEIPHINPDDLLEEVVLERLTLVCEQLLRALHQPVDALSVQRQIAILRQHAAAGSEQWNTADLSIEEREKLGMHNYKLRFTKYATDSMRDASLGVMQYLGTFALAA